MKILCVADVSIKKVIGGAERVLHEQTTRLVKQGHTVHILTRKLTEHTSHFEIIDGVHEHRYEVDLANPWTFLRSGFTNAQKTINDLCRQHTFDIIIAHQPIGAWAVFSSKLTHSIPKVYICHSLSFEEYLSRNRHDHFIYKSIQCLLRKHIEGYCLGQSQRIIVLSDYTKEKLLSVYGIDPDKITILPGAADIHWFQPARNKSVLREELKIPQNTCALFTVRNLTARMGLENLIETVSLLIKKNIPTYLIIGGDGLLRDKLQKLISSLSLEQHIKLTGFLSREDLLKHYQAADFFVLPTVELEGFGLVTVEAMACGVPALTTPVGGSLEIINKFDPKMLFRDTSSTSMAESIEQHFIQYQKDPESYKNISNKARSYIETNYSWENHITILEKLLCAESAAK